jgi:hypothetical protein
MPRPQFDPFMDQGLHSWIIKTAKKHYWRVASWMDMDDLIQDGFLCYARTRARYPKLVEPPLRPGQRAKFMSMFKRIYLNELHDKANDRTRGVSEVGLLDVRRSDSVTPDELYLEALLGEQPEEGTLAVLIAQAPPEVRDFLAGLETEEGQRAFRARARRRSTHKQTLNERFCYIAGCDPRQIDLPAAIQDAFTA